MEYPSICSIIGTLILVYIISPIQCNQKIYLTRCTDGAVRYEGYRSGTIVSQQRGLNYTTGIDCKVIIGVPEGYYIRLRFSKFEVQEPQDGNCLDFVRVFEGQTTQWKPLSSKLCGNIMPPAIMSSSNYVTIWWKTDNTQGNSLPGWQVEFKRRRGYTVERRHCLHCNSSDETSSCFANTTTVKSMKCPAGKPHCYSLARYINNTGEFLGVERGCFSNDGDIICPQDSHCSHYRCNADDCNTSDFEFLTPPKLRYIPLYRGFLRIFYALDIVCKSLITLLFGVQF
ncbi:unnamed protein product [Owenia fusiformis]|uniref:Uncharacterized protein n=1 Tax=Owenia fusiformis TaxID=6347 RepID=A0A8J1UV03_OWEFU|nr:unnamed protein product [Owenia fusiformis]